jgi:exodeoxyribonuclease-5
MFLLDGFAGTGKTYLMNVVINYINDVSKRQVLVTAPTHKAVKVIRNHVQDSRVDFATVHSALGLKEHIDGHGRITFVKDKYEPCKLDRYQFLIVDETSMLADELYDEIQIYASRGLKVLFVGDSLQIPPVSKPDSIPFDRDYRKEDGIGYAKMERIIRQDAGNPIIEYSAKIREFIYRPTPVPIKEPKETKQGSIVFIPAAVGDDYIKEHILPEYKSPEFQTDNDHIKILAWRNKTVDKFNNLIRSYIYEQEDLAKILPGERLIAMEPLLEEKQVVIHNSEEMEVLDFTLEEFQVFEDESLKYYNTHVNVMRDLNPYTEFYVKIIHEDSEKRYNDLLALQAKEFFAVRYSYAITCHKSQGSTYNIAVVREDDVEANRNTYEKNRILYTACTRPRRDLVVIY